MLCCAACVMPPLPTPKPPRWIVGFMTLGKSILIAAESCNATAQCRCEAKLARERDAAGQFLGGSGDCRIGAAGCLLVCSHSLSFIQNSFSSSHSVAFQWTGGLTGFSASQRWRPDPTRAGHPKCSCLECFHQSSAPAADPTLHPFPLQIRGPRRAQRHVLYYTYSLLLFAIR